MAESPMTADAVAADPLFVALEAKQFTERHIASLAAGVTAAVRIPGFLAPNDCTAVLQTANRLPTGDYDPQRVPTPIVRFGPALNDYRRNDATHDADRYWAAAQAARVAWHRVGLRPDPVPWPWPGWARRGVLPWYRRPSAGGRCSAAPCGRSTQGP